ARPVRPPRRRARRRAYARRPRRGCSRADDPKAGQQIVRGQVLERSEAGSHRADLLDRYVAAATIEGGDRLAQAEVAGRPGLRPRKVAGEIPVRRPLAEPADRDDPLLHLVVGQPSELPVVGLGAGDAEHVLRLAPREAERDEVPFPAGCDQLRGREREGVLATAAVAL